MPKPKREVKNIDQNTSKDETLKRLEKKRKIVSNKTKLESKSTKNLFSTSSDSADDVSLHDESDCEDFLIFTTSELEELIEFEITDDSKMQVKWTLISLNFVERRKKFCI